MLNSQHVHIMRCMSEGGFSFTGETELVMLNQALVALLWLPAACTETYSTEVVKLLTGTRFDMFRIQLIQTPVNLIRVFSETIVQHVIIIDPCRCVISLKCVNSPSNGDLPELLFSSASITSSVTQ